MTVFIPGNVPSSKNSKIKTANGVFPSKTVKRYLQSLGIQKYSTRNGVTGYKRRPNLFLRYAHPLQADLAEAVKPVRLGFYFVRDSRRKFDFHNACQIVCDLLTAHGIIEDDNCDVMVPEAIFIDGSCYRVDKNNPGVWLRILE